MHRIARANSFSQIIGVLDKQISVPIRISQRETYFRQSGFTSELGNYIQKSLL